MDFGVLLVSSFTQGQYITHPKHKVNDFVEDDMQYGEGLRGNTEAPLAGIPLELCKANRVYVEHDIWAHISELRDVMICVVPW